MITGISPAQLSPLFTAAPANGHAAALPADRIGCVLWWSAPDGIQIDPGTMRSAMEGHAPNLVRLLKPTARPFVATRRAIRRRSSASAVIERTSFWREVGVTEAGQLVVAYVRERCDAEGRAYEASDVFTLELDPSGSYALSGGMPDQSAQDDLDSLVARYRIERGWLTAQDVRDLLVKTIISDLGGCRLKAGGAVYFLPAPLDANVDDVAAALKEAGSSVDLLRFPVSRVDGVTVSQLREPVRLSLLGEVAQLAAEATARLTTAQRGEKATKPETMQARLIELGQLRERADLYAGLLSTSLTDVQKAADDADKAIRACLDHALAAL